MRRVKTGLIYRDDGQQTNFTTTLAISYHWYQQYATETGRLQLLDAADAQASQAIKMKRAEQVSRSVSEWNEALARYKVELPNPSYEAKLDLQKAASRSGGLYWGDYQRLVGNLYGNAPVQNTYAYTPSTTGAGNQRVEVRTYGAGGTYVGSQTTSAVWADIMKMGSGPAR